ncbi:MAG TPA: DUF3592 domain-containing protein [Thermoanaerobaculia bacterium]|nr:DUF3592 domain-containing protein [Thermoanaerobaculia bacterium]
MRIAIRNPTLIALLTIAIGVGFIAVGIVRGIEAEASRSWPVTTGTVLEWDLGPEQRGDRVRFTPKARYRYIVDGEEYRSDRVSIVPRRFSSRPQRRSETEAEARAWLERYPVGGLALVHYDPDGPSRALLIAGGSRGAVALFIGFGIFWLILGATLIWWFRIRK